MYVLAISQRYAPSSGLCSGADPVANAASSGKARPRHFRDAHITYIYNKYTVCCTWATAEMLGRSCMCCMYEIVPFAFEPFFSFLKQPNGGPKRRELGHESISQLPAANPVLMNARVGASSGG